MNVNTQTARKCSIDMDAYWLILEVMKISEAVALLRQKAGLSQRGLAERLGSATETVCRWETERRRPSNPTLKALSDIAASEGLESLSDCFLRDRKRAIKATVKNLPSAGTQRRVSLRDLKYWSAYLHHTAQSLEKIGLDDSKFTDRKAAHERLMAALQNAAWVMERVHDEIEIPIAEPYSSGRQIEDREILQRHRDRPELTFGLQGGKERRSERTK